MVLEKRKEKQGRLYLGFVAGSYSYYNSDSNSSKAYTKIFVINNIHNF